MNMHQTMSGMSFDQKIKKHTQDYTIAISSGALTLEAAHNKLKNDNLSLFQVAALAKAIACFQCSE